MRAPCFTPFLRRTVIAAIAGASLVFGTGCARIAPAGAAVEPLHLRVLAIHDFHGALRPTSYDWSDGRMVGGAPALKGYMDRLEKACACPTVRLDGGDQMQGTLESNLMRGESVVAALNHLGLDAAAVGNHELDWGADTLLARQREARYAWLAANVVRRDTGRRPEWARPHAVIERNGVRVGVVGYATVSTPRTLRPETTSGLEFRAGYAGIRDALEALGRERPDFVVVVAHAGGDCTAAQGCTGEMVDLAKETPPGAVHLVVGGHSHSAGEGVVNGIPIVRAGSDGRAIAVVDLFRGADGAYAFMTARETVYTAAVDEDAAMLRLLAPYAAKADEVGRATVTTLGTGLSSSPAGDRRLGAFVAESVRLEARADAGLHNPGGVRADLLPGAVSYADVHRVLPFGNTVVRLTLTGRELRQVVERAGPRYYFSNLRLEYDARGAAGSRLVSLTFADGRAVADDRQYTLGTNDFLADGGDGLEMLRPLPRAATGVTVLDAVVERLRMLRPPVMLPAVTSTREGGVIAR